MTQETLQLIVDEEKMTKYFSIKTDSTIDVSRDDTFSLRIRFGNQDGIIREHFLFFKELPRASAVSFVDFLKI